MKIAKTDHGVEHLALTRPYRIANQTITKVDNHFVRLQAENGRCGYGVGNGSGFGLLIDTILRIGFFYCDRFMFR